MTDPFTPPPLPNLAEIIGDAFGGDPGPPSTTEPLQYPVTELTLDTIRRWHAEQQRPTCVDAEATTRWWVSWYSAGALEYHGPWWISGFEIGGRDTIVAAVIAPTEDAARQVIAAAHDEPTVLQWRFVDQREPDWSPFCDRFERADWMTWPATGAAR